MASAVVWASWPSTAYAQVTTDFELGYCVFDNDGDGLMSANEISPVTSAGTVTGFSSDFDSETLYSITVETISGGAVSRTVTSLQGAPSVISNNSGDSHQPFNGLGFDADTGNGMRFASGNNYTFDIDGRCVTGSTRTDTNTVPDPDETDTHTSVLDFELITGSNEGNPGAGVSSDISSMDIAGFEIEGDIVLDMTADVGGNIVFNEADSGGEEAGDVTLTIGSGSVIYGDVVFGERSALNTNAAHDVVMSNAGSGFDLDLNSTDNVTLTNTGSIGAVGDYGIDATDVATGLTITNNSGGSITNIDASNTDRLIITNNSGASVDSILLNDSGSASTGDVSSTIVNNGTLGLLTADRVGQFSFTNSSTGVMTSPTDSALVLSNSASLNFTNAGRITASSSDTIDLTDYSGSMIMENTGSISASTNNVINADDSTGTYTINNNGTIENTSNKAVTMQNVTGDVVFNNASSATATVSSNQTALDFSDTDGTHNMDVTVTNGAQGTISTSFGTAIEADSVAAFSLTNKGTISAGVSDTIIASGAGAVTLNNEGSSASITAGSFVAFTASGATGNVTFNNEGTISAFNRTVNMRDVQGQVDFDNSGTISATHGEVDADATLTENYAVDIRRDGATGGVVTFDNLSGGTISINSDRAVGIRDFGATNDRLTITNAGTISAGRDLALDMENSDNVLLTNASGATISVGNDNAIDLTGSVSSIINNSGTISAGRDNAVNLTNASDININNLAGGIISAGRDNAILLEGVSGASVVISNAGFIRAGSATVSSTPAAISGTLNASIDEIIITNAASGSITSVGDATDNGGTIFLNANAADVNIENAGTIQAGVEAASGVTAVEANNAIRITEIGSNEITLTNSGSGKIIATNDTAIHFAATSGDISSFTLDNSGSAIIEAENNVIELVNVQGASATITNAGTIRATSDTADHLLNLNNFSSNITLTNSGTISSANDRAIQGAFASTGTASTTITNSGTIIADNETIYLVFDNKAPLVFNNNSGGAITARNEEAIFLQNLDAPVSFSTAAGSTISAADEVIVFDSVEADAVMRFSNGGTISASATTATHVLNFTGFTETLAFDNLSTGIIQSAGRRPVYAAQNAGTPAERALDFDNAGRITSAGDDAVHMTGFASSVSFVNSGTIEVTNGANAVVIEGDSGGIDERDVYFENSGTIESSGAAAVNFTNIASSANSNTVFAHFRNRDGGVIRAASSVFKVSGPSAAHIKLHNEGSIIADNGSYAVNLSGMKVTLDTSGTISSTGQTAIRVGPQSNLKIAGSLSAGGNEPRAVELEGRGSVIELIDGAVVVGTFYPMDTGSYTAEEKHKVQLTAVSNASYLYDFDPDYFVFSINGETQDGASGFSPATSNFDAMPLMHDHHGQHTRNIWREFSRFKGKAGLRGFGFSDSLDSAKITTRDFKLSGDRTGLAQSLEQSIFGLFDAQVMLVSSNASYKMDDSIFTFDQNYQGAGLGFSDLFAVGPFSLSAMVLTGLGETTMNRLVFTNTNASGTFKMRSSYDSTLLDIVYEALMDVTVYGNKRRLTRRKPYRLNLEVGFGGSLHTEANDGFKEQTHMTTNGTDFESNAVGGRVKLELEARNPFTRKLLTSFIELESMTSEISDGTDYTFSASGMDGNYSAIVESQAVNTVSLGVNYQVETDIDVNFSYSSTARDNDSDETSAKLAVKWVF